MLDTPSLAQASRPKRRFFTAEHKQRIVQEALVPGASVSRIARLHDVNANQVFKWKREYLRSQTGSQPSEYGLLPVVITDHAPPAVPHSPPDQRQTAPTQEGSIELHLSRGRVVLNGQINTEVLRIVLHSLAR
jgi:transposase